MIKYLDWGDPYYFSYPTELKEDQKAPNKDKNFPSELNCTGLFPDCLFKRNDITNAEGSEGYIYTRLTTFSVRKLYTSGLTNIFFHSNHVL